MKHDRISITIQTHKRFVLLCMLALAANIVFYLAAVALPADRIEQLHTRYLTLRKTDTEVRKTADLNSVYQKMQHDVDSTGKLFPDDKGIAEQIGVLYALLSQHDVTVGDFDFKPEPTTYAALKKYKAELKISGRYIVLKKILAEVQNMTGLFCIEDLTFRKNSKNEAVDMAITIAVYFS